jgi:outer membrane protein assembly factor BamB
MPSTWAAAAFLCWMAASSCSSNKEYPAPVDGGAFWPTYFGEPSRAPFAGQVISTQPPQVLWMTSVGPGIRGMPAVTDQVVIAASADRHLYAISRADGARFWKRKLNGQPYGPLLRADEIYAATAERGFYYVIHMTEGKALRTLELPPIAATPTIAGDTVFFTTSNALLIAMASGSDEPLWTAAFRLPPAGGAIVLESSVVYVARDSLIVVNRMNGQRRTAAATGEHITGEAASDGEALYAVTETGSIIAWRIRDLAVLWHASGFERFISGPAVTDTIGYAATGTGKLVSFDLRTGAASVIASAAAPVIATPTVVQNGLLLGDLNGRLHFFGRSGSTIWTLDFDGSLELPVVVHDGRILVPFYSRRGAGFATTTHGRIAELR